MMFFMINDFFAVYSLEAVFFLDASYLGDFQRCLNIPLHFLRKMNCKEQ